MRYCLQKIENANELEPEALSKAIRHRYETLFPGWDVCTVSLQKNADLNKQLDNMILLLQNMKTSP